jgi:hypothetical protein
MTDNHDALARYLDDLANGEVPINSQLDPELVATVRRLGEIGQTPTPHPDFVDQLEERLMNVVSNVAMVPSSPIRIARADTARVTSIRSARSSAGAQRWLPALVSAALILLLLGLTWRQFGSGEPDRNPQLGAPAIQAPATPSPEATSDQTLVEITLPADVVPSSVKGSTLLARDTIPANSVTTREKWECCPGSKVYLILDGSVSLESDGLIQVIRHDAGAVLEDVAAGSRADLGPGDAAVVRNEDSQTWTAGATAVDILTAVLVGGSVPGSADPNEWVGHGYQGADGTLDLPGGPYLLAVRQVIVDADAQFAMPEGGVNQLGIIGDGQGFVGSDSDGTLNVTGTSGQTMVFVMTLATVSDGAGTPVAGMESAQPTAAATP